MHHVHAESHNHPSMICFCMPLMLYDLSCSKRKPFFPHTRRTLHKLFFSTHRPATSEGQERGATKPPGTFLAEDRKRKKEALVL